MPRKLWSFSVGPTGARVQAKERQWGGTVYLYAWDPEIGGKRGRSLGFRVRDADGRLVQQAVTEAKRQASELSNRLIQGESPQAELTWGQLFASFRRDVVADMAGSHEREVLRGLDCLEKFLGARTPVARFGVREWRALIRARESGTIDARGLRVANPDERRTVGPRQIAKDLKTLRQVCRYGTQQRSRNGDFLLQVDPTRGLPLPSEKNPARPVADDGTLKALLDKADQVTMRLPDCTKVRSYLRELLILAAYTGRRIGAIVALRWNDWQPEQGSHGTIRWRAATDKLGRETVVPVHPTVRRALEGLRRDQPGIGEGWIFPAPASEGHVDTTLASRWLREAEKLAEIPHVRGFGFHAFRRMFATSRKHLPVQDVAAAGGWKGTQVLRDLYQQCDPETLEDVVLGPRKLRMHAGSE